MLASQRRSVILELVEESGAVKVSSSSSVSASPT